MADDGDSDAERAIRDAIAAGDALAWLKLGNLLDRREGAERDAEDAFRGAIDAGDSRGWLNLGNVLARQKGREDEAEQAFREAIAASGNPPLNALGLNNLGSLLTRQPARWPEAEAAHRAAIAGGYTRGHLYLARMLAKQRGREQDAEQAYRDAVAAGSAGASNALGWLLSQQRGREADAEQAYRDALAAGNRLAAVNLGDLLSRRAEREREAGAEADGRAVAAPEATRGQIAQVCVASACGVIAIVALAMGLTPVAVVAFFCCIGLSAILHPKERGAWGSSGRRWSMSEPEFEKLVDRVEHASASAPVEPRNPDDPLDFAALISDALDDLPEFMQAELRRNVSVVITDEGAKGGFYGLYVGDTVARDRHHDRILIARDTLIRDFGHDPDELRRMVTRVVRHELAHHLGADERHVEDLGL